MSCFKYVLDESGNPLQEPDVIKWARWFETAERHIGNDRVGDVQISTVFLALDHSFADGPPVLWETLIFGGEHDQYQKRYCTRDEAIAGHAKALGLVKGVAV